VVCLSIPDTWNLRPSCVYVTTARLTSSLQVKQDPHKSSFKAGTTKIADAKNVNCTRWYTRAFAESSESWAPVPWTVEHCQQKSITPWPKRLPTIFEPKKMGEFLELPSWPPIRTAANFQIPPTSLATDNHYIATCSASGAMGIVVFSRSCKTAKSDH
jgi:hypothetical protein